MIGSGLLLIKISIEAKGNTPKEGSPLLARTSAHKI